MKIKTIPPGEDGKRIENFDECELDPAFPRFLYERAVWVTLPTGEHKLAYLHRETDFIEAPLSKLRDMVEDAENGPDLWKLGMIHPVAKRPGKTTGTSFFVAVMRRETPRFLPTPKLKDVVEPQVPNELNETEEKAKEWEKTL